MSKQDRELLTAALKRDVVTKLRASGAKVLLESGTPEKDFRIVYRSPNILGSATVSPVTSVRSVSRNSPLPKGMEDVETTVSFAETWYKSDAKAMRAWRNSVVAEAAQRRKLVEFVR